MAGHALKYCPNCKTAFACKPANISQCQCFEIKLSPEAMLLIREKFDACLCYTCLKKLEQDADGLMDAF